MVVQGTRTRNLEQQRCKKIRDISSKPSERDITCFMLKAASRLDGDGSDLCEEVIQPSEQLSKSERSDAQPEVWLGFVEGRCD
jgi:hypothetical protein